MDFSAINTLYFSNLGRCTELDALSNYDKLIKKPNAQTFANKLKSDVINSIEASCYAMIKTYLLDVNNQRTDPLSCFVHELMDFYSQYMYYIPSNNSWFQYKLYFDECAGNVEESMLRVCESVEQQNEYKHLCHCRKAFASLSCAAAPCNNNGGKGIKFYGPVGTSGYAKACRDIVTGLHATGVPIVFSVVQYHNYNHEHPDTCDALLSQLSVSSSDMEYDHVVVHSVPYMWPMIYKREVAKNPNVVIYGITVWETEETPPQWIHYMRYAHTISVPSSFSAICFKKIPGLRVDVVPHPVILDQSSRQITDHCPIHAIRDKYAYVFYNISEWTNRKGVDLLIEAYMSKFRKSDNVLLYIKTFGDISEEEGTAYVKAVVEKCGCSADSPEILLDYKRVSDEYILCVHECCDCYVSPCRSEGHGLGVCHAALNERHVIVTGFSGFMDYILPGEADFIDYKLGPATFCTPWSKKHAKCKQLAHCKHFCEFIPCIMSWATPCVRHTSELMWDAYINRKRGSSTSAAHIRDNFNHLAVGRLMLASIMASTPMPLAPLWTPAIEWRPQQELCNWPDETRKAILLIGCNGYGNVGDDMYAHIIKAHYESVGYNVKTIPDTCVLLADGSLIPYALFDPVHHSLHPFDFAIIGGGGILCPMLASNNMLMYAKHFVDNHVPYVVLSAGLQNITIQDTSDEVANISPQITQLLADATLVTVRSINDYAVCKNLMNKHKSMRIRYFPDLVYSISLYNELKMDLPRDKIVVIFTNWIDVSHITIRNTIAKYNIMNPKHEVVFMNWGGCSMDNAAFDNNLKAIRKFFPTCKVYKGKYADPVWLATLTGPFKECVETRPRDFTITDAWAIMQRASIVLTGRYHGMIMAKAAHVPIIDTLDYNNYKFVADVLSGHQDMDPHAIAQLAQTQLKLAETWCVRACDKHLNGLLLNTPETWSENDRNNRIVKLSEVTAMELTIIQNYSNDQIAHMLAKYMTK